MKEVKKEAFEAQQKFRAVFIQINEESKLCADNEAHCDRVSIFVKISWDL